MAYCNRSRRNVSGRAVAKAYPGFLQPFLILLSIYFNQLHEVGIILFSSAERSDNLGDNIFSSPFASALAV